MTPLQATTLGLYAAAAAVAVVLARREKAASSPGQVPCHSPVAAYLVIVVAVDVLRWCRVLVLPPATGPRQGWELVLRHAEQGLYLASILALPALAWVVFTKPRPSPDSNTHTPGRGSAHSLVYRFRTVLVAHLLVPAVQHLRMLSARGERGHRRRGSPRIASRPWPACRCRSSTTAGWLVSFFGLPSLPQQDRVTSRTAPECCDAAATNSGSPMVPEGAPVVKPAEKLNGAVSVFGYLHAGAVTIVPAVGRCTFGPVLLAWLGLWIYIVTDYPELRGAGLMRVYHLVEVGAVLFSGLCFARWLSGPRLREEGLSPAVACTLALMSGPVATIAAPWLVRGTTLEAWPGIVAANAVAVGITLVLQLRWLLKARRRRCFG